MNNEWFKSPDTGKYHHIRFVDGKTYIDGTEYVKKEVENGTT